jgi:hypothetical protein
VDSADFAGDKELLQNTILAIKVTTGFDRVDAGLLVRLLQVVAMIEDLPAGTLTAIDAAAVDHLLTRPVLIPDAFLMPPTKPAPVDVGADQPDPERGRIEQLTADRQALDSTYHALMGLHPSALEVTQVEVDHPVRPEPEQAVGEREESGVGGSSLASRQIVRLGPATVERLDDQQRGVLDRLRIDPATTPIGQAIDAVRRRWVDVSREVLPHVVPSALPVYRVGAQVFAVRSLPTTTSAATPPQPDFSKAITRPVGYGNLQVVRQELIGYEAGEVSHIENVLEGELLKHATRRTEVNELTITTETESSQSQERDQQSTVRNELATEAQKEAGQQTTSVDDQTTSTTYGKLVENSKSNYARSVTDRAVNTVSQMVREQRVQREKKTFVDKAVHELDNRSGTKNIRGIYQWVDKKFRVRVLNYGTRLLYDVVVPEPASFLIQSLKDAAQPETFQLTKPIDPGLRPSDLDGSNYAYYAAQYGVTGSVTPPPEDFVQVVNHVDTPTVPNEVKAFGQNFNGTYYGAFSIHIPDGYKAISGYVQHTNVTYMPPEPGRQLEVFIGESYYLRFGPPSSADLNQLFTMGGETGDLPVTLSSWDHIIQFNYAVGINCQRTDKALEQWQLKTHATIVSGYQRQLSDYEDKLGRYLAAVRTQMAAASNYAHDPTIEQQELKKAFIYLLLGEHYSAFLPMPAPAPVPPLASPPDPTAVKQWGAMVAFFERAFEWDNIMYTYYPYFWGAPGDWEERLLIQDVDPEFEAFLKAGAARVVTPARPGFEAALAHYHETGEVWMGEEIPDMFSDEYVSIIAEIKARNRAPGTEVCVSEWDVKLPTTLVMLKDDETLPEWKPAIDCNPPPAL